MYNCHCIINGLVRADRVDGNGVKPVSGVRWARSQNTPNVTAADNLTQKAPRLFYRQRVRYGTRRGTRHPLRLTCCLVGYRVLYLILFVQQPSSATTAIQFAYIILSSVRCDFDCLHVYLWLGIWGKTARCDFGNIGCNKRPSIRISIACIDWKFRALLAVCYNICLGLCQWIRCAYVLCRFGENFITVLEVLRWRYTQLPDMEIDGDRETWTTIFFLCGSSM